NYGKITVRVLPTDTLTQGPKQAQDTMMSSDQIELNPSPHPPAQSRLGSLSGFLRTEPQPAPAGMNRRRSLSGFLGMRVPDGLCLGFYSA
ncbi:hypothetical protein ACQX5E_02795, partial [Corynebacterium diphtheriae]